VTSQEPHSGNRFLFLATTLQKLTLGLWPFWGGSSAPIHYLDIDAHPDRLTFAAFGILRRRIPAWLRKASDYRSGSADTIIMQLDHRFVLDGEEMAPGPSGKVELRSGRVLDFITV
jgi:hypothetical protein